MKKLLTFYLASLCYSGTSFAQSPSRESSSHSFFIQLSPATTSYSVGEATQALTHELALTSADAFVSVGTTRDQAGGVHERYAQYYHGLPVEGAVSIVHARHGRIESINGHYEAVQKVNVTPAVAEQTALALALRTVGAKRYSWQASAKATATPPLKGELVVVSDATADLVLSQPTLAWKFQVYAVEPFSFSCLYIDAQSGKLLGQVSQVADLTSCSEPVVTPKVAAPTSTRRPLAAPTANTTYSGTARTRYHGVQQILTDYDAVNDVYFLHDYSTGSAPEWDIRTILFDSTFTFVDFTDQDNDWWQPVTPIAYAGTDIHWSARAVDKYFRNVHRRNSYDDRGGPILNVVPYDCRPGDAKAVFPSGWGSVTPPGASAPFQGLQLFYGPGIDVKHPMASIDVVAHEFGHGINFYTARLGFNGEPGSLNEALSDIWGACSMGFIGETNIMWKMAQRVAAPGIDRPMDTPKANGLPDTYLAPNYNTAANPYDNITVITHWFYLLSAGGSGVNGVGNPYSVTGIGWEKAAKIVYLLETGYLFPTSNFCNTAELSLAATVQLYGGNSSEYAAVLAAWNAVNVRNNCSNQRMAQQPVQPTQEVIPSNSSLLAEGLYPNPAGNTATIALLKTPAAPIHASIYNAQGRMVKTVLLEKATTPVDLHDLQPGLYHLWYQEQDKAHSQAFRIE